MTKLRFVCCFLSVVGLAGTADRTEAQNDPSSWRFGVSIGGGAALGVIAEYWSDDIGIEARLGTYTFQDVSVRLSPKWRVGAWDDGEVSWRVGVEWLKVPNTEALFLGLHGVELAKVTEGGHVIGGSYNLPLFGTVPSGSSTGLDMSEDPDDPDDPETLSRNEVVSAISILLNLFLGELTYRYQPS